MCLSENALVNSLFDEEMRKPYVELKCDLQKN